MKARMHGGNQKNEGNDTLEECIERGNQLHNQAISDFFLRRMSTPVRQRERLSGKATKSRALPATAENWQ